MTGQYLAQSMWQSKRSLSKLCIRHGNTENGVEEGNKFLQDLFLGVRSKLLYKMKLQAFQYLFFAVIGDRKGTGRRRGISKGKHC